MNDKIPPADGPKLPDPVMHQHNLNHYHSAAVERIAVLALRQLMAGRLVIPESVKLAERHVTHRYLKGYEPVEFKFTFHVVTGEKSRPTTTWMVSVSTDDVSVPLGCVVESTPMRNAKVYEWDDEKGWQQALEFEHPYAEHNPDVAYMFDTRNPLDWPPIY